MSFLDQYTFKVAVRLPKIIRGQNLDRSRSEFVATWARVKKLELGDQFLGIFEGEVLATTPTYDSAEAPRDRDWVSDLEITPVTFYFSELAEAERFKNQLVADQIKTSEIEVSAEKNQDWNENWRKSFLGIDIEPCWSIRPTWQEQKASSTRTDRTIILLNPGMGFGSGTHSTTQLCLEWLGHQSNFKNRSLLDFGAGSGILSVAAALKGAVVDSVEIDDMALQNAKECAHLNHVETQIHFEQHLQNLPTRSYDTIIANILRPVLIAHADILISKLLPEGFLVLSGLLESDIDELLSTYQKYWAKRFQKKAQAATHRKDEWWRVVLSAS